MFWLLVFSYKISLYFYLFSFLILTSCLSLCSPSPTPCIPRVFRWGNIHRIYRVELFALCGYTSRPVFHLLLPVYPADPSALWLPVPSCVFTFPHQCSPSISPPTPTFICTSFYLPSEMVDLSLAVACLSSSFLPGQLPILLRLTRSISLKPFPSSHFTFTSASLFSSPSPSILCPPFSFFVANSIFLSMDIMSIMCVCACATSHRDRHTQQNSI